MKVLNLYACLGGNRYKWDEVANIQVTAVELDPELARLYKERFPNDTVIITDAHEYLLNHYHEYDFIWSSPPCPTHSRARYARRNTTTPIYPSMTLYQEIIFLRKWFDGLWVVENVIPYYEPLIEGKKIGRHMYWSNLDLPQDLPKRKANTMMGKGGGEMQKLCDWHEIDLSTYKGKQRKDKIARNLVDYVTGKAIFEIANETKIKQTA